MRPAIIFLTLPAVILSLGLFLLAINALQTQPSASVELRVQTQSGSTVTLRAVTGFSVVNIGVAGVTGEKKPG